MRFSACTYFVSFILLLHCIGSTQLLSAYARDKDSFVRMLAMTEEETKKEKDATPDDPESEFKLKQKHITTAIPASEGRVVYLLRYGWLQVVHQYIIELPTPPPDHLA